MCVDVWTLAIRGRGDSHDLETRRDGTANAILTPNGGRGGIGVGAIAITRKEESVTCAAAQLSIFSLAELPASPSPSPDSERDWLIRVATSPSRISQFWIAIAPPGAVGRTCPASCQVAADGTLVPFSEGWGNSGMGGPTESWTLNTSEWPSAAVVCSLSAILEAGNVPQRYYLTPRACQGILRRAEKRGRELPKALYHALLAVSEVATIPARIKERP